MKTAKQKKTNGSLKRKAVKNLNPQMENGKKRSCRLKRDTEPLKRVLVFLKDKDIAVLKKNMKKGEGISTKIREIVEAHLK